MDSHFDHVMKKRAEAGDGKRLYFAYSTILDRAAFETWRTQHGYDSFELPEGIVAQAMDLTLIFDFGSRWWGGRVAGLKEAPGSSVYGLLFEISEKDWPIIAHKEGAVTNMCMERPVKVRVNGEIIDATAFTTRPERATGDGPVSVRFVDAMKAGAKAAGLPAQWVAQLETLAR
ncbi:MAG: gamma-glutamylcyclotransferase [Myxococcaceae bacterium]|nr:gamma-glutamylcyclotransferase [Myxococcaceae bacterium]